MTDSSTANSSVSSGAPAVGSDVSKSRNHFVMTQRQGHLDWMRLGREFPAASVVLHLLVARMGKLNALVISHKLISKLSGYHRATVVKAVAELASRRWVQVLSLNGTGSVCAFVVNDRIAWGQPRDELRLSIFSAQVVVDHADQDGVCLDDSPLRTIPVLFAGEHPVLGQAPEEGEQLDLAGIDPPVLARFDEPILWRDSSGRLVAGS